jgi:RES domain-containing protein
MAALRSARDHRFLDALERIPPEIFDGQAWRIVRDGRDPAQCSAVGGRWDDRTFDVLYSSSRADGAIAEMYFRLRRGQPVMPSQVRYRLFELRVALSSCLRIASLAELSVLGMQTGTFGQLSYAEREQEYPRSQEVAEAAQFIGRDGMIVPSARSEWANIVVFCDPAGPSAAHLVKDHGLVDWDNRAATPLGY